MNCLSGSISAMNIGSDALRAFAGGINATAHNIANVSTENFTPLKTAYETGPNDVGVRARTLKLSSEETGSELRQSAISKRSGGTDLAIEFPQLIRTERAFEANASVIRTSDDMAGIILDLKA